MPFLKTVDEPFEYKGYTFKPLTFEDGWAKFISYIQYKPYYDAVEHGDFTKPQLDKLLDKCMYKNLDASSEEVLGSLFTQRGLYKFLNLSCVSFPKNKTEIIEETFDQNDLAYIGLRLAYINGLREENPDKEDSSKEDEENPTNPNPEN